MSTIDILEMGDVFRYEYCGTKYTAIYLDTVSSFSDHPSIKHIYVLDVVSEESDTEVPNLYNIAELVDTYEHLDIQIVGHLDIIQAVKNESPELFL